jgi:hypothetical protein
MEVPSNSANALCDIVEWCYTGVFRVGSPGDIRALYELAMYLSVSLEPLLLCELCLDPPHVF